MEHIDFEVSSEEKSEVTDGQDNTTCVQVPEESRAGSSQIMTDGCDVLQGREMERASLRDHDGADIADVENQHHKGEFPLGKDHGVQPELSDKSRDVKCDIDVTKSTSVTNDSHQNTNVRNEDRKQLSEEAMSQHSENQQYTVYEEDIHSAIEYMEDLYMQDPDFEDSDEISDTHNTTKTDFDSNSTDIHPCEISEQNDECASSKHGPEAEGKDPGTGTSQKNMLDHNDEESEIMFQADQASTKIVPGMCIEEANESQLHRDKNEVPSDSLVTLANEQVGTLPCDLKDSEFDDSTAKENITETDDGETDVHVTKSLLVTGWDGQPEVACLIRGPQHLLEELGVTCSLSDRYQQYQQQQQNEDDSQELLSQVLCLQSKRRRLPQAVTVCVPYTVRGPGGLGREVVGKVWRGGSLWEVILPEALDCVYPESEDDVFAEFSLHELPTIAVVLRLTKELLLVDKQGGSFKSSFDPRVLLNVPEDFTKSLVELTLQVQPVPVAVVTSLQTAKDPSDADACLIAASPIVSLGGAVRFMRPLVLVLPCPRVTGGVSARMVPAAASHAGSDIRKDGEVLRLVAQPTVGGHWTELSDVKILNRNSDFVQVELHQPVRRLLLLRLATWSRGVAMAGAVVDAVRSRQAVVLAQRHAVDAGRLAVVCCALSELEVTEQALQKSGFDGPPGSSHPFPAHEGQELYLHFTSTSNIVASRAGVRSNAPLFGIA